MGPLETLRTEGSAILDAPWSFAFCVVVLILLSWAAIHLLYKERVETLRENVKGAQDEAARLRARIGDGGHQPSGEALQMGVRDQVESFATINISQSEGYWADITFHQAARNTYASVEIFYDEIMAFVGGEYVWLKYRRANLIQGVDFNKGQKHSSRIIKLERLSDSNIEKPKNLRTSSGIIKAVITITATQHEPLVANFIFLEQERTIRLLPPELPSIDGGNAHDFKEEECVIWV